MSEDRQAPRLDRLAIPLTEAEYQELKAWAKGERLPVATVARKVLLDLADKNLGRVER